MESKHLLTYLQLPVIFSQSKYLIYPKYSDYQFWELWMSVSLFHCFWGMGTLSRELSKNILFSHLERLVDLAFNCPVNSVKVMLS